MASITINQKNSYKDFDALLTGRDVSPPEIQDVSVDIPYKNGDLCFTYLNGKPVYNMRTLTYTFDFVDYPKTALRKKITLFENWIMSSGECEIYDEADLIYHFKARPISCKESESGFKCTVTVTFKAYPFKISSDYANAKWDDFCFETDYLNPRDYELTQGETIAFYNYGINDIVPKVTLVTEDWYCVIMDLGTTNNHYIPKDTENSIIDGLVFKPGLNEFVVSSGSGTLSFIAQEEVI